jgi:hypothetical protein
MNRFAILLARLAPALLVALAAAPKITAFGMWW